MDLTQGTFAHGHHGTMATTDSYMVTSLSFTHGHVSIVYTQCFTIASVVVVIVVVVVVVVDASQAVQH